MKKMSRSMSVMREITEGILLRREGALREIRWGGGWLIVGRGDNMNEGK